MTDFRISNWNMMVGLTPTTMAGDDFLATKVNTAPWQWRDGTLWLDFRRADDVINGIAQAGLKLRTH